MWGKRSFWGASPVGRKGRSSAAVATVPTFVGWGTLASGAGTVSPGVVTGTQVGDVELMLTHTSHTVTTEPTLTDAQGFALALMATSNSGGGIITRTGLWWRRLAGVVAAPTLGDVDNQNAARICAVRGCATSGNPWDFVAASQNNSVALPITLGNGTTLGANRLVMNFISAFTGGAGSILLANAGLANFTERLDQGFQVGSEWVHLGLISGEKAAAGVVGNTTGDYTTAYAVWAGVSIALKP